MVNEICQMTGFEPRISGIEIDLSINWATTTARILHLLLHNSQKINVCNF